MCWIGYEKADGPKTEEGQKADVKEEKTALRCLVGLSYFLIFLNLTDFHSS